MPEKKIAKKTCRCDVCRHLIHKSEVMYIYTAGKNKSTVCESCHKEIENGKA